MVGRNYGRTYFPKTVEIFGIYQQSARMCSLQYTQSVDQFIEDNTITVIRHDYKVAIRKDLFQACQQLVPARIRVEMRFFIVETHNVLTISQDAQLVKCACKLIFHQVGIVDTLFMQG